MLDPGTQTRPPAQILGISGSPIPGSNTDRMVQAILGASGLPGEFVKLSRLNVRPCIACLGCKADNLCKVKDDFPALAAKVKAASAVVVGGYAAYGLVDGFTKAFLERLFSLRHRTALNRGRLAVAVATGNGLVGGPQAAEQIANALRHEGMEVLGALSITGSPECMVCGYGEGCPMSALPRIYGPGAKATPEKFGRVEDQAEVWAQGQELGREIGRQVKALAA